jgi:beta-lactamase class A
MHVATHHQPSLVHRASGLFQQFQYKIGGVWLAHGQQAVASLAAVSLLAVGVQVAYPRGRALPFTQVGGKSVSMRDTKQVSQVVAAMNNQPLRVRAAYKTYDTTPAAVGVAYDVAASARAITSYPLQLRLIPFSALVYGRRVQSQVALAKTVDERRLQAFTQTLVAENTRAPQEGAVYIEHGKVLIKPPQTGTVYSHEAIKQALKQSVGGTLLLQPQVTQPVFGQLALEEAKVRAHNYAARPITITAGNKAHHIGSETVLSWLRFVPDAGARKVRVDIDASAVKAALAPVQPLVYIPATSATVTLVDGREAGRAGGSAGRVLNLDASAQAVIKALTSGDTQAAAVTAATPVPSRLIRTYSSSSVGLQALLNDWVATHHGPRWGIVIKELGGTQRTASVRANERFVTASVYKPFVAMVALNQIAAAQLDPNAPTSTGKSLDACIELMIVHSDNACAHAVGDMVGWGAATAAIQAKGFTNTSVAEQYNFYTTPTDTTAYLEGLFDSSLMSAAHTSRMLGMLRRQVYRNGIPTGSRGSAVANKVGYTDSYRHDVGIVYHPKSAYVLSILSYGGTYPQIVDLARTVHDYFSR